VSTIEKLISQAVDCLTVVIESPEPDGVITRQCERAREKALDALRVCVMDRINGERT
jgi:hypothetical protein